MRFGLTDHEGEAWTDDHPMTIQHVEKTWDQPGGVWFLTVYCSNGWYFVLTPDDMKQFIEASFSWGV
jgi:hypothetical protein